MDGTKTRDEWDTYNSASWLYTFYVRDASGNIMTTYTKTGSEIENNVLKLDEVMLYGSSRIGTREISVELTSINIPTLKVGNKLHHPTGEQQWKLGRGYNGGMLPRESYQKIKQKSKGGN